MNKSLFDRIREDLWVIVMDIIAVNAAYLITFFLRYYVHSRFVPAAVQFVSDYLKFAPAYTVICIAVFALFKLYGGMWRYANVNDMNRIIAANGTATIVLIVLNTIISNRLPVNIYAIAGSLQFLFTVIIRYACRIFDMEKRKMPAKDRTQRNVMIIGTGVNAANTIRYLSGDSIYKPVVVAGKGDSVRGLPVMERMDEAIIQHDIKCIIVADPSFSDRKREALRRVCEHSNIELHDYSGLFKNQSGALPLTDLTQVIDGNVEIKYDGQSFDSVEQAMEKLNGRYRVKEISGRDIVITIEEYENDTSDGSGQ